MSAVLEISAVDQVFRSGFWHKRVQVLHELTFRVPEKSVFGFLGANGAGKTTLINLIVGIRVPTQGHVRVFGFEAASLEARSRIGFLPERPYFHDHLTGEDFLKYFGALSGMSRGSVNSRIEPVLAAVGMTAARKILLRNFSKGMLQRIGIAQALLHDPEFLVLDEPMSGLDPVGRKDIRELILRLASEGRTVFFSSHVIPDVEAICDQVALIQKGRLKGCGKIDDLLSQGVTQTEIAFSGLSLETASKLPEFQSLREIPEALRGTVGTSEGVQKILAELVARKAKVLWVTPMRPSLESLFGKNGEGASHG